MNNVLMDELPREWNGYVINTWFQIGIQITLLQDDDELSEKEKTEMIIYLLFGNDDGSIRDFPMEKEEQETCISWFLNGWYLDNVVNTDNKDIKMMDYDVDQWRIYADFLQIYHIDLAELDMHWWMFQGLLWNMPVENSSFMQCLQIRQKQPHKGATAEEKKAIQLGHKRFDLKQKNKKNNVYTSEEEAKIDDYDKQIEAAKKKKVAENEALNEFERMN